MCHRLASFALAIAGQAGFLISLHLKSNTPDDGNEQPQPDGFPGQSITSPTLQERQRKNYIFVYVKRDEKIHKLITSKGNEQRPNENWPQPTGQEVIRRQEKESRIRNLTRSSFDTHDKFHLTILDEAQDKPLTEFYCSQIYISLLNEVYVSH